MQIMFESYTGVASREAPAQQTPSQWINVAQMNFLQKMTWGSQLLAMVWRANIEPSANYLEANIW